MLANTAAEEMPAARTLRAAWARMAREVASPPYRRAAAGAAAVAFVTWGFAMANFTLSGDEWFSVFPSSTLDTDYALWAGRWIQPLVWAVTGNGAMAPFFSLTMALVLLIVAGLVAASAWRLTRSWAVFAVAALYVTCPLFTDSLSFEQAHFSSPIAAVLAAAGGWLILRHQGGRLWRIAMVAGLVVWALASYQPTALVFAVVVLGGEVRRAAEDGSGYWKAARWRWLDAVIAVLGGAAVYAASVRLAWWVTGTDPGAGHDAYSLVGGYPALGDLGGLVRRGGRSVLRFWFGDTALYPLALKAFALALIALGVMVAARAASRRREGEGAAAKAATGAWVVLLAAASLVVPFSVLFLRSDPPTDGSNFTSVGLVTGFWAGLLLEEGLRRRPHPLSRPAGGVAVALALILALGGAFQVNKGFVGLFLSNQRDLANANRMLSVMEQMPEFALGEEVRVELVGKVVFHEAGPPFSNAVASTPAISIVNCSGLSCQNRLVHMLNLIGAGDRPFVVQSVSRRPAVRDLVASMPPWPEPGSIRYLEGTFVVKGG